MAGALGGGITAVLSDAALSQNFVAACPTDAITHGHGFEIASYDTSTLIYGKSSCSRQFPKTLISR